MIDYNIDLNFDHIDFAKGDTVYFLDYSFSNIHNISQLESLLRKRHNPNDVIWIDHHKTSIGLLEEYDIPGIRKIGLCGAAWTYLFCEDKLDEYKDLSEKEISEKFHSDLNICPFLKYIDDYDCWKKIYPVTNDFHYGLNISHPTDYSIDILLSDKLASSTELRRCLLNGDAIQTYLKKNDRDYHVDMYGFEYTLPKEHGGLKCFCLNRKGNSIMFGDKINQYDAVIPFYYNNGKWTYSIFSVKENIDCSEVAKTYGGGGHRGAAGFAIKEFIFDGV